MADIEKKNVDKMWCLGDIVGYGPEPCRCIELVRQYDPLCVVGNHDLAAIGKLDLNYFNPIAAQAILWTAKQLGEEGEYLGSLPLTLVEGDFTLVHGSPREPVWEYLLSPWEAYQNFSYFTTSFCLVGHSHIPLVFTSNGEMRDLSGSLKLQQERLIINPGGVGQPRDGNPQASYAIYDEGEHILYHFRVEYDIKATQRRMAELGLPTPLALRLSFGR